jgi:Nucleotidyl transferase of unknown function (DUF2204)
VFSGLAEGQRVQPIKIELDQGTRDFYVRSLTVLNEAGMPYLVGGAYAMGTLAGIERHTKDLDVFVRESDRDAVLSVFEAAGYGTEVTFPHWLAKAWVVERFVDVIYRSGNGVAEVDDDWFAHAVDAELLGMPVRLCPPEEIIWSKAYVQERERFDGADIAHLIRKSGRDFDWRRLIGRFGEHWRILLSHLVTFGFVYPAERDIVPAWVTRELTDRLREEAEEPPPEGKVCQGTLLSREQYLVDIAGWDYEDARLVPRGMMTAQEITHWTAAIASK